jgi:hypothetical protein
MELFALVLSSPTEDPPRILSVLWHNEGDLSSEFRLRSLISFVIGGILCLFAALKTFDCDEGTLVMDPWQGKAIAKATSTAAHIIF